MKEPTIAECLKKADLILNGQAAREEVSDWACEYVAADDPAVEDETVWEMLVYLSGFDLKDSPDAYLHTIEELKDWMAEVKHLKPREAEIYELALFE
ncbi:DNA-binding protein [Bacillus sp. 4A_MP3]